MARVIDEDTPGWVRWTLVGIVFAVLLVVGVFVWLLDPFSSHEAAPTPAPTTTATTAAASSSICGLPDGDQAVPTKAPQASWDQVGSLLLPSSPTLGPGKVVGTKRTCFAHSPAGAVVASYNSAASDSGKANPMGVQLAGYRIIDATKDRVTLTVALRLTQGEHAGELVAEDDVEQWQAGDWKSVGGSSAVTAVANLDAFVPFGPGGH